MPKEAYLPQLFALFRQYGYDGVTLSKISEATGLGKASLYHHFPGGKEDMVISVLDYSQGWLQENVLAPLAQEGEAAEKLRTMCDRICELYGGGTQPCALAVLQGGTAQGVFHDQVKGILQSWVVAIATTLTDAGLDPATARQRGENALIAIQGSLMLARALDDPALFQRVLQQLPDQLCP